MQQQPEERALEDLDRDLDQLCEEGLVWCWDYRLNQPVSTARSVRGVAE